ncbi:MAG TPA: VanZ family protein [Dehalococcoidia bacterium]|jgi:VanZ family protein|nr:VanZ family protein [Dehalococcoidia bacterium]
MSIESPEKPSGIDKIIHFVRYGLPVFAVMAAIFAVSQVSGTTIGESSIHESASGVVGPYTDELAHFIEFFVLSALIMRWILAVKVPSNSGELDPIMLRSTGQKAMLLGVLYAFSDEAHQWFIADRSVELIDLLIDGIGAIMGSAVYMSVFQAWRLQKSRNR